MSKGSVVVNGVNGMVGFSIAEEVSKQYPVIGISRNPINETTTWKNISGINLLNAQDLNTINWKNVEVVVHVAAQIPTAEVGMEECSTLNKRIDENMLLVMKENPHCAFIFISTCSVYGAVFDKRITEESEVTPPHEYAVQKVLSEKMFTEHLSNCTVLRINAPYSERSKHRNVLRIFLDHVVQNKGIQLQGEGKRKQDFIHANDIGRAVLKCIELERWNRLYNVASGTATSMKELAELVNTLDTTKATSITFSGLPDAQEHQTAEFDISKIKNELQWEPVVSLKQGLTSWINKLQHEYRTLQ